MTVVILCSLSALAGYIVGIPIGRAKAEQEIERMSEEAQIAELKAAAEKPPENEEEDNE